MEKMIYKTLRYSRHAIERMFQRGISPEVIECVILVGEIIADYPDDTPYPSSLILGVYNDQPIHVVLSSGTLTDECTIITVYKPDPAFWDATFRIRRSQ